MSERYEHLLSVIEQQICAEAFKASQYEKFDTETAADATIRQEDWEAMRFIVTSGRLDAAKFELAVRHALTGIFA